jgi:hypothetical protein
VSACNPPCAAGEQCNSSGECAPQSSGAPPNTFFSEPEPPIAPPEDGVEQHDGFMLRLALGFGASNMIEKFDESAGILGSSEFEYSGFSVTFSLDLGGSPVDDLVIHGRIADFLNASPSVSMDGEDLGEVDNLSLAGVLFGVGVTYYFMPINLYITGVVGPSWISVGGSSVDSDGDTLSTDVGFGLNFDIGKEWWVGDNWGLGVAGRLWVTGVEHESSLGPIQYGFVGGALMFSATYQ